MATAPSPSGPTPGRSNVVTLSRSGKVPEIKWRKWALAACVLLVLGVAGVVWRSHLQNTIIFETLPVERGAIQAKVTATGNLNAVADVLVSSQVSGNIQALSPHWNSKVKKDQLVALIDTEISQAQVDQATPSLRSAHAATLTAQAQIEKAKADLTAANAPQKSPMESPPRIWPTN